MQTHVKIKAKDQKQFMSESLRRRYEAIAAEYESAKRGKIGSLIRNLRMDKGLSQAELAKKIGVTPEVMSKIEGGERAPLFMLALQLAKVFDTEISIFDWEQRKQ